MTSQVEGFGNNPHENVNASNVMLEEVMTPWKERHEHVDSKAYWVKIQQADGIKTVGHFHTSGSSTLAWNGEVDFSNIEATALEISRKVTDGKLNLSPDEDTTLELTTSTLILDNENGAEMISQVRLDDPKYKAAIAHPDTIGFIRYDIMDMEAETEIIDGYVFSACVLNSTPKPHRKELTILIPSTSVWNAETIAWVGDTNTDGITLTTEEAQEVAKQLNIVADKDLEVASLAAWLRQSRPQLTEQQIFDAVQKSNETWEDFKRWQAEQSH